MNIPQAEKDALLTPTIAMCACGNCTSTTVLPLRNYLYKNEVSSQHFLATPITAHDRDRDSALLFSQAFYLNEQFPYLGISPNYDPNDPNSPLLCSIITTVDTLNALNIAMLGSRDTTLGFVHAGQGSARLIRALDEHPEMYGMPEQSRVIEYFHPDVRGTEKVHDWIPHRYTSIVHDKFHITRNSVNPLKPLCRYLRKLLNDAKQVDMSKAIWKTTDMDLQPSSRLQTHLTRMEYGQANETFTTLIKNIFDEAGLHFDSCGVKHDHNLLLVIDMLLNERQWEELTQVPGTPIKLSSHELIKTLMKSSYHPFFPPQSNFTEKDFDNLRNIIMEQSSIKSYEYYILRFRLRNISNGKQICEQLEQFGLNKICKWKVNGGLMLRKEFNAGNTEELENLSDRDLAYLLTNVQSLSNTHIAFDLTPAQAANLERFHAFLQKSNIHVMVKASQNRYFINKSWLTDIDNKNQTGKLAQVLNMPVDELKSKLPQPGLMVVRGRR